MNLYHCFCSVRFWFSRVGIVSVLVFCGGAAGLQADVPQDNTLVEIMLRKGLLTAEEAAHVVSEAKTAREGAVHISSSQATRLTFTGRVQAQYVSADLDVDGATPEPAAVARFLVRRVYIGARAEMGPDWSAHFVYDLANQAFDRAVVQWRKEDWRVEAGQRLVVLGREPIVSSAALKAIERSAVTRYFMEDMKGDALSASGYRTGVFVEKKSGDWVWGGAVTNPEASVTPTPAPTTANNTPAFWAHVARNFKGDGRSLLVGAGLGWSPDQGGVPANGAGKGLDLAAAGVFLDYTAGRFALLTEVLVARDEGAAVGGADADVWGAYVQPSWSFTPAWEGVFRVGYVDTDGRGIKPEVAAYRFPSGPATNRMWDAYVGFSRYFLGNDVKLQAGIAWLRGEETPAGAPLTVEGLGVRTQLQANF